MIAPLVADRAWSRRVLKLREYVFGELQSDGEPVNAIVAPRYIRAKYPAGGGGDLSGRLSEPATGTMLTSNVSPSDQPMSSTAHQ